MLQNSHKTLRVLTLPKLVIPDIDFPQLTKLQLPIGESDLQEFQTFFPQALKNMKNLEIIDLCLYPFWQDVGEYICENYPKQCISANANTIRYTASCNTGTLSVLPVKILQHILDVDYFANKKYTSHLQYVHFNIWNPEQPMRDGWNRYRENFDRCINLKAIELEGKTGHFMTETLPNMSEANQEIWNERICYFQARGIRLANQNEIRNNENLRNKLAKEAGATWRFHFW